MSIFRSGMAKPVFVKCLETIYQDSFVIEAGHKYELVLEMGTMYVIKMPNNQEAVVPKDGFVVSETVVSETKD
jgi:hypothetical protein